MATVVTHSMSDAQSYRWAEEHTAKHPVIIVEDDDDIRDTFREVLEAEGYHVLTAANGKVALDLLEDMEETPCLVLLDLMMPVMNGWQLMATLKSRRGFRRIPVVVVSAAPSHTTGAARVIRKPIDVDDLLETVRRYAS